MLEQLNDRLQDRPQSNIPMGLIRLLLPIAGIIAYERLLRPRLLTAGSYPGEAARPLPGDELIPITNFQSTRGIDIDAPTELVWQWVAQIGRDSTGYYGLDALTNRGIPSASYLRKDLPPPKVGDPLDNEISVLDVKTESPRFLLYGAFDLPTFVGQPMERTTLILLEERLDGGSRVLIRTRAYTFGMFGALFNQYYEWLDYFHSMAQLNGLKLRAETAARLMVEPSQSDSSSITDRLSQNGSASASGGLPAIG